MRLFRQKGKELPAWGIFIRHADDIRLDNVRLKVFSFDYRPAVVASDVKGVVLEGVDIQSTPEDKREQFFMYKSLFKFSSKRNSKKAEQH